MNILSMIHLTKGKTIGDRCHHGFVETFNFLVDILRNLTCTAPLQLTQNGDKWFLSCQGCTSASGSSGGIPDGYEERANSIIALTYSASDGKLTATLGTVLVKTGTTTSADVVTFTPYSTDIS